MALLVTPSETDWPRADSLTDWRACSGALGASPYFAFTAEGIWIRAPPRHLGTFGPTSAEKFAVMGRLVDGYAAEASALTLGATAVERVLRLQEAKCEAGSVRNDPTRSTAHPMRQVPVISPICWPCWSHIHMHVHRCARTCSCTR